MTPTSRYDGVLSGGVESSTRVVMIGAGQLARMTHQAAIDYGITLHVLAASAEDPAVTAGAAHTLGYPDRYRDLVGVASHGEVVTFEHELVRARHLRRLEEAGFQLRPHAEALAFERDRLYARRQLANLGHLSVAVPAFAPATSIADVSRFAAEYGWPVILKARGGEYAAHGVHVLDALADVGLFLPDTPSGSEPAWMLEEHLEIAAEFSILVARRPSGYLLSYPPIGIHREAGVSHEFVIPAELPAGVAGEATRFAESIIAGLDATGVCTVEFFWTTNGRLLLNKLTLRPHNSGNVTIEACTTTQYHQHLRAILDWPLGPTTLRSPGATVNLIGGSHRVDLAARLPAALGVVGAHVHLYAKTPRPGRKFGHVTALGASTEDALEIAQVAAALLIQP